MKKLDWIVIPFGIVVLVLAFIGIDDCCLSWLIWTASGFVILYLLYAFYLLVFKRPEFDWHLINGHFLRKVCVIIMLAPFFLTAISMRIISSPKEMVYEENLYKDSDLPKDLSNKQKNPNIFWSTYYHFINPGCQHMTTTERGRNWSAIIGILGVLFINGLLVSSIIGWIDRRKEKWLSGEIRYRSFLRRHNHYIVVGGNDIAIGIIKQMFSNEGYILILTSCDVERFRRELFSALSEAQQKRIIIYYGSRTSLKDVEALCVGNAAEIFIIGEAARSDDHESYHDTMNMKCLELVWEIYKDSSNGKVITGMHPAVHKYQEQLAKCSGMEEESVLRQKKENMELDIKWKERPRLNCRVMFEYQTTFSVFQFFDLDNQMDTYVNFIPFNYYEIWAQNVLINRNIDKIQIASNFKKGGYLPLEGYEGIKSDDEKYVHLFIVGMSRMGVAMAIEAAHLAHYPNFEEKRIKTMITFVDKNAAEEKEFFMGRFQSLFNLSRWRYGDVDENGALTWSKPHYVSSKEWAHLGGDILDIEWEFINGGIECSSIQDYILSSANPDARITIAVCLPESNCSHAAALYLNKKIYESDSVLQVLVYNRYGNSIVNAIGNGGSEYPFCGKLRCFGSEENCVVRNHLVLSEEVGSYIEDAYVGNRKRYAINPDSLYDGKSKSANQWSSIYNGNTLWTRLRSIDYNPDTFAEDEEIINILADVEHNRWNMEELLMNFRPLTAEEQENVRTAKANRKEYKSRMAHVDICSNRRLKDVDGGARKYDLMLARCLNEIYNNLKNRK